ncbi:MAG: peptidoglycan DD-metalloendopeptidase family protein [Lachnospiraceae bacterium]
MKQGNTNLLQKLKDNAFYVALGIGLIALLAVVAVYTVEQQNNQIAELDLNTASDYKEVTTEEPVIEETNGAIADLYGEKTREDTTTEVELQNTEEITEEVLPVEETTEYALPVSSPAGELSFNSEETISWPVNGEVILPYSMNTTVHFKTLDQYQCNPGMMIAAGSGTTVKSAYLGQVTKVTSDNIYGNMVTVYLGNDYSAVYGQLDTIYVKEGDYVKAGDSIGTIGAPTDSFTEEGSHLFFQLYDGDTPVDPMLFIE